LFLCVGILLARGHSLRLDQLGGLASRMPVYATFLMLFVMANVGLPGTSGFVGEILVMIGAIQANFWVALLVGSGMILSVMYMLVMIRRVLFDKARSVANAVMADIGPREWLMLAPLAVLVIVLGFVPGGLTHIFDGAVQDLVHAHVAALSSGAHARLAMIKQ
jgi:NADH-quinone oxidoreductase subunit M